MLSKHYLSRYSSNSVRGNSMNQKEKKHENGQTTCYKTRIVLKLFSVINIEWNYVRLFSMSKTPTTSACDCRSNLEIKYRSRLPWLPVLNKLQTKYGNFNKFLTKTALSGKKLPQHFCFIFFQKHFLNKSEFLITFFYFWILKIDIFIKNESTSLEKW